MYKHKQTVENVFLETLSVVKLKRYFIYSPDLISVVALATLTTQGIPYSLATTAP